MAHPVRDSLLLAALWLLPGAEVHATEAAVGPDASGGMPGAMPPGGPMMSPMAGMPGSMPGAMPGFPGPMPGVVPGSMPGGMPFPGGMPGGMGAPGMAGMPGMPAMPSAAQEAQGLTSLSAKSSEVVSGLIESFFHKNKLNKTELQCLEEGTGKLAGNFMIITSHSIKLLQQIFGLKSQNGLEDEEPPQTTTTTTRQDKADLLYYYKDGLQQANPAAVAGAVENVTAEDGLQQANPAAVAGAVENVTAEATAAVVTSAVENATAEGRGDVVGGEGNATGFAASETSTARPQLRAQSRTLPQEADPPDTSTPEMVTTREATLRLSTEEEAASSTQSARLATETATSTSSSGASTQSARPPTEVGVFLSLSTTLPEGVSQSARRLSMEGAGAPAAGADPMAVGMPGMGGMPGSMMGGMPGMAGLEESEGFGTGGAMGGAMMVLSASALFMELGVSLKQVVRLSHDIAQECVQKDARDALKQVSEHIRSVEYITGHIVANGADIMQELADAVEAFQHGNHKKFGNDLGDALRLVFLSNQTTAVLPEGIPETEVLENMTAGMIDGFFGEGFALDLRVGHGKLMHIDLHQCMAENIVFFQSIWSSIMCFFAQRAAEHNAMARAHGKLSKKQVAHMRQKDRAEFGTAIGVTMARVPAALRRCNISKREEAMLLDSIKGFGNGLTFGVQVPEDDGAHKDDVSHSIAQTVDDFKDHEFYTFGNDLGQLLQLLVISMFPQKYTVDATGKLQTQLLGASEGADRAKFGPLSGHFAAFHFVAFSAVALGASLVVAHCRHARTRVGGSWRPVPTGLIFNRTPRTLELEATDPILQSQAVDC